MNVRFHPKKTFTHTDNFPWGASKWSWQRRYFLARSWLTRRKVVELFAFTDNFQTPKRRIVHAVKFDPPVGELATRNGSYECVRFSFRVDNKGLPVDIRTEESSNDYVLILSARQTLDQFRFRRHQNGSKKRLMLVFDGMVGRWPEPPPSQK